MLFAACVAGIMLAGCSESNEITEIIKPKKAESQVEPLSDEVSKLLEALPDVSDVTIEELDLQHTTEEKVYRFNYNQLIDHKNPALGTFKQRVSIKLVSQDAPVVLYTHGYEMDDSVNTDHYIDLIDYLNANTVSIEHRYFNKSQPETYENLNFTYLWTDQAAADLHAIVDVLKNNLFTQNKWISTGLSKGGVTTALYAYYSDRNGWDDIDLYVPFCAPFLPATTTCSDDIRIGQYLYNNCGAGYDTDSEIGIAYARLRKLPIAIADDEDLREACIKQFYQQLSETYLDVINNFGRSEEEVTCALLYSMFESTFAKFTDTPFQSWAKLVPDVDKAIATATTEEEKDTKDEAIEQVVEFIFMTSEEMTDSLEAMTQTDLSDDDDTQNAKRTRSAYTVSELLKLRLSNKNMPYLVQAARELGHIAYDYSMLEGTSISVSKAYAVSASLENHTNMQLYATEWDGGQLMNDFRSWVKTQSKYKMLFVYCSDDPWTGGAIDDSTNPSVTKVVNKGGCHNDAFLDRNIYSSEASQQITDAIRNYIGL